VTGAASRGVALIGLATLTALILQPPDAASLMGAAPLAVLVVAGLASLPRWAIATAILMLPYFCYGVMEIITNPAGRLRAIGFAALTIAIFLAALDSMRRR
jgi:uncharacterized membrane protein